MSTRKDQMLQGVEAITGCVFQDPDILWEALHAPGAVSRDIGGRNLADGNKRLALVGDAFMKAALLTRWYLSNAARGIGNNMVSTTLSNNNLASVGNSLGLDAFIVKHPGQFGPLGNGTISDTIEAIIGAVWEDSKDFDKVVAVMGTLGLA
ncbi:uncharacterized protein KY384_003969 [Bacidia gigantensis]|uniref:uncharacterized protein n=1 Tax=Bacidia gigantensis TaxID=2732470 RepID=UPI001D05B73D|nr:uncharacterized protein KY384_003969 [Bacidia gigantensis]KAG8532328.1 hypothetical protein KY384_003969 [Bacidia gigantensis]